MDNPFWDPIKHSLATAAKTRAGVLLFTTVLLPLVEGMLIAFCARSGAFWLAFIPTVVIHLFLATILITSDRDYPLSALARAVDQSHELARATRELGSQCSCYELVEGILQEINSVPCNVDTGIAGGLDDQYRARLSGILKILVGRADAILGVDGHRFTIQILFRNGFRKLRDTAPASAADQLICEYLRRSGQDLWPRNERTEVA